MDIAHKEYLEKHSKEELIEIVLKQEKQEEYYRSQIMELNIILEERKKTAEILLKVIKYQNNGE